ncbi:hypothetical protein ACG83_29875 [Frankia sp. R43]|uniref:hypothetical protein n=1 Tax=Frankia sp. R43 TaxID=269536 RepID=UPI0006CA3F9C|nr:hypothetical protein [Frankia sp. R43]KPM52531.1 hypothetical protein ACG83_29875 [Frankia sp. R43]
MTPTPTSIPDASIPDDSAPDASAPDVPAPPKFAWLDGELVDWSDATVHVTTPDRTRSRHRCAAR